MANNVDIVREFIAAWSKLDADELADYFTDDGSYHNMPTGPVTGRDNVRKFIQGFLSSWTATNWDVLNIMGEGNVVIAERLDRTRMGDRKVDLPCCGVFEMENGKIKVWRDYFDLNTYVKAASG